MGDDDRARARWAVIFLSELVDDAPGYEETAERLLQVARRFPGFVDARSVRAPGGAGITVSFWESREAIAAWRDHPDHARAREKGRNEWYASFEVIVCRVEEAPPTD